MLRFLTAGESHGMALAVIVEGLPAGLPLTAAEIQQELARRRLGFGRGPRMRFEVDKVAILAGKAREDARVAACSGDCQHRVAEVVCRDVGRARRHLEAADEAASRSRRFGRHAEVWFR